LGRTDPATGSQKPCLRCGAVANCDECEASLSLARRKQRERDGRCEAEIEAAAGLTLEERLELYGRGDVGDGWTPRRTVRDPSGHGAGVRPRRSLSQAEAGFYVPRDGVLVDSRTGKVARSNG
jgi:hypothetical protein